jgi:hypothetical protein
MTNGSPAARPGSRRLRNAQSTVAGILAVALLAGGCVRGGDDDRIDPAAQGPARALAKEARPLTSAELDAFDTTESTPAMPTTGQATTTVAMATRDSESTRSDAPTTTSAPVADWRRVAVVADPVGDADGAPRFADVADVAADDNGAQIRVMVRVHGTLPDRLAEGEVIGVGFDVFRTSGRESDYQLFADGGSEGWFAYLQTPTGFVEYPGSLQVGGDRIVFTVPWDAIGGVAAASFSLFFDYSNDSGSRSIASADRAPDGDRAALSP